MAPMVQPFKHLVTSMGLDGCNVANDVVCTPKPQDEAPDDIADGLTYILHTSRHPRICEKFLKQPVLNCVQIQMLSWCVRLFADS